MLPGQGSAAAGGEQFEAVIEPRGDLFDAQGKPWRVQEAYMETVWELPACAFQAWIGYDLNVGRYIADSVQQEGKTDWLAGREGRIDPNKFDANQLRRAGSR